VGSPFDFGPETESRWQTKIPVLRRLPGLKFRHQVRLVSAAPAGGSHLRAPWLQVLFSLGLPPRLLAGGRKRGTQRTGFPVPSGHYEFNRLPFCLSNSPASFQRLMDTVLRNSAGTECCVFLDYVIVYSRSAEEHAARLEHVLARFDEANLQLHPGKCALAQSQVNIWALSCRRTKFRPPLRKLRPSGNFRLRKT